MLKTKTTTPRAPRASKIPPTVKAVVATESTVVTSQRPTKLGIIVELASRPDGARMEELMAATGWQAHSVRGALSGGVKKQLKLNVTSQKTDTGRVYRVIRETQS
jgi:hypothetical protein